MLWLLHPRLFSCSYFLKRKHLFNKANISSFALKGVLALKVYHLHLKSLKNGTLGAKLISCIEINMKTDINPDKMVKTPNLLLEYAIDSLLKTFNSQRKPVMPQSTFYKLMNILDTRLRNQGVDIELPGYWYRYGFYIDINFLDIRVSPRFVQKYTLRFFISLNTILINYVMNKSVFWH